MAAAVGVTPMILSGSSMWSPLGSAIAFGLVGSMFFTLIVIPVLYVLIHQRGKSGLGRFFRATICKRCGAGCSGSAAGICVRRCRARATAQAHARRSRIAGDTTQLDGQDRRR